MPTAKAPVMPKSLAIKKPSSGESSRRLAKPIVAPLGYTAMRLKSPSVSAKPRLDMMMNSASGSSSVMA